MYLAPIARSVVVHIYSFANVHRANVAGMSAAETQRRRQAASVEFDGDSEEQETAVTAVTGCDWFACLGGASAER
jgi:hypothetical protein